MDNRKWFELNIAFIRDEVAQITPDDVMRMNTPSEVQAALLCVLPPYDIFPLSGEELKFYAFVREACRTRLQQLANK